MQALFQLFFTKIISAQKSYIILISDPTNPYKSRVSKFVIIRFLDFYLYPIQNYLAITNSLIIFKNI